MSASSRRLLRFLLDLSEGTRGLNKYLKRVEITLSVAVCIWRQAPLTRWYLRMFKTVLHFETELRIEIVVYLPKSIL